VKARCRIAAALRGRPGRRHRDRCLRCQASAARLRGFERSLQSLRTEVVPAPPGLHGSVMRSLPPQDDITIGRRVVLRSLARRVAAAGMAAATGAAVLTGLARWRSRPLG
jgi:hypothetical protein